jgi:hypothetical protein
MGILSAPVLPQEMRDEFCPSRCSQRHCPGILAQGLTWSAKNFGLPMYGMRVFRLSGSLGASVTILITADQQLNVWFEIVILPEKVVQRVDLRRLPSANPASAGRVSIAQNHAISPVYHIRGAN